MSSDEEFEREVEELLGRNLGDPVFSMSETEDGDLDIFKTGILPPSVDDHWAMHLLEGIVQFTAYLYAGDYVAEYVEDEADGGMPGYGLVMKMGLGPYLAITLGGDAPPEHGSPADLELMAWVRVSCGRAAVALERYLAAHGIAKMTVPVYLNPHGWYPMSLVAGPHEEPPAEEPRDPYLGA